MIEVKDIDFEIEETIADANSSIKAQKNRKYELAMKLGGAAVVGGTIISAMYTGMIFDFSSLDPCTTIGAATTTAGVASLVSGAVMMDKNDKKNRNAMQNRDKLAKRINDTGIDTGVGIISLINSLNESKAVITEHNKKTNENYMNGTKEIMEIITKEIYFLTKEEQISALRQIATHITDNKTNKKRTSYQTFILEESDHKIIDEEQAVRKTLIAASNNYKIKKHHRHN